MQSSNSVIMKGVREGLLFIFDDDVPFSVVLTELSERISANPDFFKGANVIINAGRRVIDRPDFEVVYKLLTRNGMRVQTFVSLSAQSRMIAEGFGVASRPPSFAANDVSEFPGPRARDAGADDAPLPPEARPGIFLSRSLRPGESVRYGGNVCVLGDVEVGAEIVADGDIVVWGALLGAAHAGANGDDKSVVCALQMSPTQLAIADYISRFPAHEGRYPLGAESSDAKPHPPLLARVESERIVVMNFEL